MTISIIAAGLLACAATTAQDTKPTGRDAQLVTPAPITNTTGRIWIDEPYASSGNYGAPASADDALILIRVNHQAVAISPWTPFHQSGFQNFERARQTWLREYGYTQSVRTHVNARYHNDGADEQASRDIKPRATIRINDELPRRPSLQRVMGPISSLPISRSSDTTRQSIPGSAPTEAVASTE